MSFSPKLFTKGLTRTDLILMSDVWVKGSLLMIIALEGTLRLTIPSREWNVGSAGFSPFRADDVYLFFLKFLMENHQFPWVFYFDNYFYYWKTS